jgi:hypothetical protein
VESLEVGSLELGRSFLTDEKWLMIFVAMRAEISPLSTASHIIACLSTSEQSSRVVANESLDDPDPDPDPDPDENRDDAVKALILSTDVIAYPLLSFL